MKAKPIEIDIVLYGGESVGKTSLLIQYLNGFFPCRTLPSITLDSRTKSIIHKDTPLNLKIWSTAGQERFNSSTSTCYTKPQIGIVMYDMTDPESYKQTIYHLEELEKKGSSKSVYALVGNKIDRIDVKALNLEEVYKVAQEHGAYLRGVSARTGFGVNELFNDLIDDYMNGKASFPGPDGLPRTATEAINNLEVLYPILKKKTSINIAHSIKIGLLSGVPGVGKSKIRDIFMKRGQASGPTSGTTYNQRVFDSNGVRAKIEIWDTTGRQEFRGDVKRYCKEFNVVMLVYDVTDKKSFKELSFWMDEFKTQSSADNLMIVVGNKMDLIKKEKVSLEKASDFARDNNALLKLTSAETGFGVKDLFESIVWEIQKRKLIPLNELALSNQDSQKNEPSNNQSEQDCNIF